MPWVGNEGWEPSRIGTPDVEDGGPQPTGLYGPNGQPLYRTRPIGFNRKPELIYLRREGS